MSHTIRTLTPDDYTQFLALICDFRETTFTETEFVNTLEEIKKSSDIFVLEQEGKLIATGTVIYEHKFIFNLATLAHIEDVCVKKEFRRMGYGKLIVRHLVAQAKQRGCYKITLDCNNSNVDFYKSCDFEVRGNQMSQLL